jgi:hypothetical protein
VRRVRAWTVALTLIFGGAVTFVTGWGAMSTSAQPPMPSPSPTCPPTCPIPASVTVAPGGRADFTSLPSTPTPGGIRPPGGGRFVRVDNQTDQPASVAYDGQTLTITLPAGSTIDVGRLGPGTCAPVDGQPNVVACRVPSRPPAFVTVRTVGATAPVESLELMPGCTNVVLTLPNGTSVDTVAAAVTPAAAMIAIWRLDAATGRFSGWSPVPGAPNDLASVNRLDPVFICVREAGTLTRPAI